jgi:hypothetical protein
MNISFSLWLNNLEGKRGVSLSELTLQPQIVLIRVMLREYGAVGGIVNGKERQKYLPRCHFVHHKSNMDRSAIKPVSIVRSLLVTILVMAQKFINYPKS